MAHITLSTPDKICMEMKGIIKGEEWLSSLPKSTKARIEELKKFSKEDWKEWHKQVREKESKQKSKTTYKR